jgi:hypothetical protein
MENTQEIPSIGRLDPSVRSDFVDDASTIVEEPYLLRVRKLQAAPADELENLEDLRGQLRYGIDHLVDQALDSVQELRAMLECSEQERVALAEELSWVVRHSNALVRSAAKSRRADDTLIEFPRLRAS